MTLEDVCQILLRSKEPSIRWKMRVLVLGEDRDSARIQALEQNIRRALRVRALLARRDRRGLLLRNRNPYAKWQGPHWVLATLADIGYPRGDPSLSPMRDQLLDHWLGPAYYHEYDAATAAEAYKKGGVPRMVGRFRRCASQQGNALYSLTKLGLADARTERLAERLLHWQWPDGGWNCDRTPGADTSSFWESRHPMLGLALHAERTNDAAAKAAVRRAAEVYLSRGLFRERHGGRVMNEEFLLLHYPLYYYYDILGGLKAMVEIGQIRDPRCQEALDHLEAKQLSTGGWAADRRLYRVTRGFETRADYVDWGGARKSSMNEWITADALYVLKASGRM